MKNIIESWNQKHSMKKNLLKFLEEMEKNLETYYVMDQRQFIVHGFVMDRWQLIKDVDFIKNNKEILLYCDALNEFNKAYEEYKNFEKWYVSDLNNKSNDNARKLHGLKDGLQIRIKNFESIIIYAGQALEKELLKLGYIDS